MALVLENMFANEGYIRDEVGSIPVSEDPLEEGMETCWYFCLESPRDGGVWWAIVLGVMKSWI